MTTALVGGNYRPYDPVRDIRRLPSVWLQINYDCPKLRLLPTFTELLTLLRNKLFSHLPFRSEKNCTVVMFRMKSDIYPSVYEGGWRGKGLVYWWQRDVVIVYRVKVRPQAKLGQHHVVYDLIYPCLPVDTVCLSHLINCLHCIVFNCSIHSLTILH